MSRYIIIQTGSSQGSSLTHRKHFDEARGVLQMLAVQRQETLQIWDNQNFKKVLECGPDGVVKEVARG